MSQGVRAYMQQSRVYVGMILILIFGEVLGLYGYVAWMTKAGSYADKEQFDCRSDFELEEQALNCTCHIK